MLVPGMYTTVMLYGDIGKLDIILNSALRSTFSIRNPRDEHNVNLYNRANLFSLTYRHKYFLLNLIHRLVSTEDIVLYEPVRQTHRNIAP